MENKNFNETLETLKFYSTTASQIFNLFKKANLSSKDSSAEDWKKFEHDMVKEIYNGLGENNPPEEVCNLTAMINSFALSLASIASLEVQLEEAKKKN